MSTASVERANEKVVSSPTKEELQELEEEYVALCTKTLWQHKRKVTYLLRCNLCKKDLKTVLGAKSHIQEKKHLENKILKKVEEALKLVGSPNEEQFEAITVKLKQVYDEWSAEACGQQTMREKIVSDFQEFVQQTKGCEDITVELYGSTYTGFALKDSDINMNLRFNDNTSSSSYYTVISGVMERITTMGNGSGDDVVYTDLKNNLYSSVSHITFTHRPSGLSCHVRYGSYHKTPINISKLLQRYGEVDHRMKLLAVVLKYWAKLCQLDIQELGSYPSQMFVLMLVHFLQQRSPPILPVPPKPNDFSDTQQCLEHFDEYLSGLDHMIKTWKVTNTESLGMLWLGMFRFYMEETLASSVIQVTQKDLLLKKDTSWGTYKLPVVLSPVSSYCNYAKASNSWKMYVYLETCFKATMMYFGRPFLNKPSTTQPTKGHSKPQGSGPCINGENVSAVTNSPKQVTYLTDIASQLCGFTDGQSKIKGPIRSGDHIKDSDIPNQTCEPCDTSRSHDPDCDASHDLDYDTSCDLDHNESVDPDYNVSHDLDHDDTSEVETSCEHNDTQVEDSVVVEDIEVNDDTDGVDDDRGFQYEFVSSNFTAKMLPDVCSLCKQEGHTFTSLNCPSSKKPEKKYTLAVHPPLAPRQLEELERVYIKLKETICLKPEDRKLRKDICDIIKYHVKTIYPDAELALFGSSSNEFGSANSDIDINMRLPGNFEHDSNAKVIENVAHHLKTIAQQDWLVDTIQAITTARVPLVKMTLTHRWNDLECDISLGNYLALHNTELLATYASIDKRVQVLGYVLKKFAKRYEMCDASTGSLSSYAYILLLLHYLQQVTPPVIPVLQQIGKVGCVDVDGWNCWFYQFDHLSELEKIWPHVGENKSTVGELLIDFFKYYLEEFDWQKYVVNIRKLEPLHKIEKEWVPKQVCIEDPFNHDHNLSSHLSKKMWSYICGAFQCAHDHITSPQLYTQHLTIKTVLDIGFAKEVPQDGLCYTCGKRGHRYYNCPNQKLDNVCDLCGKLGHLSVSCPSKPKGYFPKHSDSSLVHPPPPPHTTTTPQPNVPHTASKYTVYPSSARDYQSNKKKTATTKRVIPVNTSASRPFKTSSSQPHGRLPLAPQFTSRSVRDATEDYDSPRRMGNQQGSNRGRTSRGAYHHKNKQSRRRQQDSWPQTK